MSEILAVVGPITTAVRLEKKLKSRGDIKARVISTPIELGGGGCSYSVIASLENEGFIRAFKGNYVKKIYIPEGSGEKRVYHDIS
ncbi:MAG: DUF3343 domain-containing protein [Ruminococcaceae bacterium]|nr:DUF3343 domain-containing protein [Oscillospiraceae bacterium]